MFNRSITVLFCSLVLLWPASVRAQQGVSPEKAELIKELLELTNSKKNALATFDALMDQNDKSMSDIVWQAVIGLQQLKSLTPKQQEDVRKVIDKHARVVAKQMRQLLVERVNFSKFIDDIYFPLFDKHFTADELKELNTFYRSPVGRKTVTTFPEIFGEAVSKANAEITPKVTAIMNEIMDTERPALEKEISSVLNAKPAGTKASKSSSRKPH